MSELITKIFDYFENRAISMSKKMTMLVFCIIVLLLVDNYCGFSYYFVQSYKLDYITNLEDARLKYSNDKVVSQELDKMMVNALNRWTVYNAVSDIFQETFSTTSEAREQQLVEELSMKKEDLPKKDVKEMVDSNEGLFSQCFPVEERSPFWHTLCSSLNLVFLLAICVIYLIFSPFVHDANKKDALIGMCAIIPILVGGIFITQWIVSFIPDIYSRPRINNFLYVVANISVVILLTRNIKKN